MVSSPSLNPERIEESQYVAIRDRKLLDIDNVFERLVKGFDIKNYDKPMAIEFVFN
jgi:hypothetical protein